MGQGAEKIISVEKTTKFAEHATSNLKTVSFFLTYNFRKTRSFLGSSLNIDSLREHSVFSTLVLPAVKNRRPQIRLRFAG